MSGAADDGETAGLIATADGGAQEESPAARAFQKAKAAHWTEVKSMLAASPQLWREPDSDGYTLVHWAALGGNDDFVAFAVEARAAVDVAANNGQTPLMWAAIRGHITTCARLLEADADPYARDSFGASPLVLAVQHRMVDVVLLLVARGDKEKLLAQTDVNGCGPVHWAAYKGDVSMLKLLKYFDADFQALDNTKMTPLHRAAQSAQASVCAFLLESQVDPSQADSQGRTVLDLVEQNQDALMRRTLCKLLDISKAQEGLVGGDVEAGGGSRSVKRKDVPRDKKQMEELKEKAIHSAAATFWLVSVSLSVFQYLTEVRPVCWETAPHVAMAFEIGVPLSLGLFLTTVMTDPGKVPARLKGHSGVEELLRQLASTAVTKGSPPDCSKLCTTTWVLKGPRMKYCQRTGACVEEFDHFCGWLNVAIGKGNHRPFIILALVEVSTQMCHLYLCWVAATMLVKSSNFGEWFAGVAVAYPLTAMMVCLQGFTTPGVLMLCFHQLRLIIINMTTNEMINCHRYDHFWREVQTDTGGTRKMFSNPFDKGGAYANCVDFWCRRRRADLGPRAAS